MPLTSKGSKILGAMEARYGAKKGKSVFYASINKGKLKGVEGKADGGPVDRLPDHYADIGAPHIEDRRDYDPTLRLMGIEALKARAMGKHARSRMASDMGSAEIVDMVVPRGYADGGSPYVYNDRPTPSELRRLRQEMLDRRGSAPYRNFGPNDLTDFPDRNAFQPDPVMTYRREPVDLESYANGGVMNSPYQGMYQGWGAGNTPPVSPPESCPEPRRHWRDERPREQPQQQSQLGALSGLPLDPITQSLLQKYGSQLLPGGLPGLGGGQGGGGSGGGGLGGFLPGFANGGGMTPPVAPAPEACPDQGWRHRREDRHQGYGQQQQSPLGGLPIDPITQSLLKQYGPQLQGMGLLPPGLGGMGGGSGGMPMGGGGGGMPGLPFASGGGVDSPYSNMMPGGQTPHAGFIPGAEGGRSDTKPKTVAKGSYVLPSDIVSAAGDGNSIAGAAKLGKMFGTGPYGTKTPKIKGRPLKATKIIRQRFQDGGMMEGDTADIMASDGEMVLEPAALIAKFGDLDLAHEALDKFVIQMRKQNVKKLSKLPGPKQ